MRLSSQNTREIHINFMNFALFTWGLSVCLLNMNISLFRDSINRAHEFDNDLLWLFKLKTLKAHLCYCHPPLSQTFWKREPILLRYSVCIAIKSRGKHWGPLILMNYLMTFCLQFLTFCFQFPGNEWVNNIPCFFPYLKILSPVLKRQCDN